MVNTAVATGFLHDSLMLWQRPRVVLLLQEEIDKIEYENEKLLSESLSGITDPVTRVQQLLWLNNKMRLSLRNLYVLQHEKNMLKHKVMFVTFYLLVLSLLCL